jgi:opacity protein-like surface antigen
MKKVLSSIVCLSAMSAPAAFAEPQFGVFGGLGQSKFTAADPGGSLSKTDTGFSLGGLYKFNDNFALEGRYDDFGAFENKAVDSTDFIKVAASALSLGVRAGVPVSDLVNIYARLGASQWDLDADRKDAGEVSSASDSGTELYYGFGVEFSLSPRWSITAEYSGLEPDLYSAEDDGSIEAEIFGGVDLKLTTLNLGVNYFF